MEVDRPGASDAENSTRSVSLQLTIPVEVHEQIARISRMRRKSLNDILLDLIDRYMPSPPPIERETSEKKEEPIAKKRAVKKIA